MRFRYKKRESGDERDFTQEGDELFSRLVDKILEYSDITEALFDLVREGRTLRFRATSIRNLSDVKRAVEAYRQRILKQFSSRELFKKFQEEVAGEESSSWREGVTRLRDKGTEVRKPWSEKDVQDFLFYWGDKFHGSEELKEHQLRQMADLFKRIERTVQALENGEVEGVDVEVIKGALGIWGSVNFERFMRALEVLEGSGYVEKRGSEVHLSPLGIRRLGEKALRRIFEKIRHGIYGNHPSVVTGSGEIEYESSGPYEPERGGVLDITGSLKEAVKRIPERGKFTLRKEDLRAFEEREKKSVATCLLIDMSWSMSWGGKFTAAKKLAVALHHLINQQFPRDAFYVVGFYTVAEVLRPSRLPYIDLNVNDPFTNIQDALRLASRLLRRHTGCERHILLVTDGQPTAYFDGDLLHVEWPVFGISPMAFKATLDEVSRVTKEGIVINTFMLDENPALISFVEEMTRINGGRAFFTTPHSLGEYVVRDYLRRRRLH